MHRPASVAAGCLAVFVLLTLGLGHPASGMSAQAGERPPADVYLSLKEFHLEGGVREVDGLVLRRDRVEMTFHGTFFFESPVAGQVRSAVFLGRGQVRAEPPGDGFERDNVRRLLGAEVIESDFTSAVLRFTDDTFDRIGPASPGAASANAVRMAREFESRQLERSGENLAARLAMSILNGEAPGVFVARFSGGRRGDFVFMLDPQARLLSRTFGINAGETGVLYGEQGRSGADVWTAFYPLEAYETGSAVYADAFDVVEAPHYELEIDVRNPRRELGVTARIDLVSRLDGLWSVPLQVARAMRLRSASLEDGGALQAIQEPHEDGLTLYLPRGLNAGERVAVRLHLAGDYMFDDPVVVNCYYPLSSTQWYPRHGYLTRSTFDLTFRHSRSHRVASSGVRLAEGPAESGDEWVSRWRFDQPVPFVTFGVGNFEYREEDDLAADGTPIQFSTVQGLVFKEEFVMAEMGNALNFFSAMFGAYPYPKLGGVFHPRGFGQGLPSLLLLPPADRAERNTFSFIAHETAHQWWGNVVGWRSYRDQWLSEGFAEYSGVLYTAVRSNAGASRALIEDMRRPLTDPPRTDRGMGRGRLAEVGPIYAGVRLNTRETVGAYQTLIYGKGALVLRMLHYLLRDPQSFSGDPFFDMMKDFVERHRGELATTRDFQTVAGEHFARTELARRLGAGDLDWFFNQWVYGAQLPSYRMEYRLEPQEDGSTIVRGMLYQDGVSGNFFMPLPVRIDFRNNQAGYATVYANGAEAPFAFRVPQAPSRVELDPDMWVLSAETRTRRLD